MAPTSAPEAAPPETEPAETAPADMAPAAEAPDEKAAPSEPLRPTLDDAGASGSPDDAGDAVTAELEPPTQEMPTRELQPVEPASPASPPRKATRGVWILVVTILIAAVVGPLVFWLGFWRFEPTAQRHIPAGTVVAVRADARALFLFGPFRDHVLPALTPPPSDPTKPALLARVRSQTGVDLGRDVREVVLATPDASRWAILLGGRFQTSARRGPFIEGFEQAVEAEPGAFDWTRRDDVLVGPRGAAVAQAEDGTILLTSTEDLARAARHATDDYRELWLSSAGDISFSIGHAALLHAGIAARGSLPEAAILERAERITGWIVLGERESKVVLDVLPRPGEAVEPFGAAIEALIKASLGRLAPVPGEESDRAAGRALGAVVLGGAKVQVRAETVLVTSKAPRPEVEDALRALGPHLVAARPR
jgi:hypothetical protein